MNVLEKILEEIEGKMILVATSKEHYNQPQNGKYVEEVITIKDAENIIRSHMDDVKNDGWIPVSERLPEESDYYMACIYNDEADDYDFRKTWFAHADDYDMDESEWRELYDFERVIAWQPLPEPYKEE